MLALLATILIQEPALPTTPLKLPAVADISGVSRPLPEPQSKATVLLFVAVDCPIANRLAPEIGRIETDYAKKGFAFYRVYVDTTIPRAKFEQHGKDFGLNFPAILDAKHFLVKKLGISVTPQAAVLLKDGSLVYRGRVNDLYLAHGQLRAKPTRDDLRIALDEIGEGKRPSIGITRAIGCDIPDIR